MMKRILTKKIIFGIVAFAVSAALSVTGVLAASYKSGDSGENVKELQEALNENGYSVTVDGIFGSETQAAVKAFQQANGLTVDGIAGSNTLKALGLGASGNNSDTDVYLIARAVYGEARGEEYLGKVAVAAVILNRVDDPAFPNTVSGVVYQPGAFDAVSDGQINLAPDEECIRAAQEAFGGADPTDGCVYYYNPQTATNKWMLSKPVVLTVGKHVFCR